MKEDAELKQFRDLMPPPTSWEDGFGLKAMIGGEQELKQERNGEEALALELVNEDLKQAIVFTEEETAKVQRQRDYA
jgi:hypothetical protein